MRMSSGASVAYEKPRSGRSICMRETPRSSRIASARTSFAASWASTTENSPRRKRAWTPARCCERARSTAARSGRGRSRSACPCRCRSRREQRRVAAGAEGGVDDRLARAARRAARAPRRRERGRGQSRWAARRSATSSALPSTSFDLRRARRRDPRSRGGRGRRRRRPRARAPRAWRASAGSITRPCLSGSASTAPEKKKRCIRRPSWLSGSSPASRLSTSRSQPASG